MSLAYRSALIALATSLGLVASCGSGTAGLVANGGGGGDGGTNSPGSMSAFTLDNPKVSPTQLHFVLSDPEADPATVELRYQIGGAPAQRLTHISGVSANPTALATSAQGIEYGVQWDFSAESELPDDGSYVPGIQVFGVIAGGIQEIQVGANAASTGLGNDPPVVIDAVVPSVEVDGIVGVAFEISDSSDDIVDVRVEYDIVGDAPDAGWRLARPALLESTPMLALEGVLARSTGSDFEFFWDTDVDLDELEHDVRLRFTAVDSEVEGDPFTTSPLHVDNNAAPIAVLHEGLLVTNRDQRRDIPISFSVTDDEGDEVEVVLQWRRPGTAFPQLPATAAEIQAALADPEQRRELQICSERPRVVEGHIVPVAATTVELPDLASSAAALVADGIVGSEIELLRASHRPDSIAGDWTANPLQSPIAALPIGDGLRALVVDSPLQGSWRAIEIEPATGTVVRELGAGSGLPTTAAMERNGRSVLVASTVSFAWRIDRVDLESGRVTPLIAQADVAHAGRIRGIASLGPDMALVTLGNELVRLDWSDPLLPRAATLVGDLATPWGVVLDPLHVGRAYVSEHDAVTPDGIGRVVSIDLRTYIVEPIVAVASDADGAIEPALPRPRDLALARDGCRLLALCDLKSGGSDAELRALDLRAASPNRAYALSDVFLSGARSLATGPDDLVIVVGGGGVGLLVGGGVEQRRTIVAHDVSRRRVDVSPSFSPVPKPGHSWRITRTSGSLRASNIGQQVFLWNSDDAFSGNVLFRVTPIDAEVGLSGVSLAAKQILSSIGGAKTDLGGAGVVNAATVADMDRDGDLDLVSATIDSLCVHFQARAGVFDPQPTIVNGAQPVPYVVSVDAADLDGDGDLDLAAANNSDALMIFWQTEPGKFDPLPTRIVSTNGRFPTFASVQAADLDGDGDLDLLTLQTSSVGFTIYWQTTPGQFDPEPTLVSFGNFPVFAGPAYVRAADVDGDGDLDLVSANVGKVSPVSIYLQSTPGQFDSKSVAVGEVTYTTYVSGLITADLDADGRLDVAVSGSSVYWQSGPGEFAEEPSIVGTGGSVIGAEAADVDGDGDLDLIVGGSGDSLTIFRQTKPRVFDSTPFGVGAGSGVETLGPVLSADVDGDGDIDLVAGEVIGEGLNVYWKTGAELLSATPSVVLTAPVSATSLAPFFATCADLDRDGDLDVAYVSGNSPSSGVLAVAWQTSPGEFDSVPTLVSSYPTIESPRSVSAIDVDGDGNLDLVTANYLPQTLAVFLQTRSGEFSSAPITVSTSYPFGAQAADVDGDGRVDLVTRANGTADAVRVFWQTSSGEFDPIPTILIGSVTAEARDSLSIADVDRDGRLDLVSARGDLTWYRQSSSRQFVTQYTVPTLPGAGFSIVEAVDMDGDGDLDLVAGGYSLTIFWQTNGAFVGGPPVKRPGGANFFVRAIQTADLDRDGDVDIVVSSYDRAGTVAVFRQTSVGVFEEFSSRIDMGEFNVPEQLLSADVDGDGDRDVLSLDGGGFTSSPLKLFFGGH